MAPDESWVVLADGDRRSRCVVLARQSLGAPRGVFGAETLTPEDGTANGAATGNGGLKRRQELRTAAGRAGDTFRLKLVI